MIKQKIFTLKKIISLLGLVVLSSQVLLYSQRGKSKELSKETVNITVEDSIKLGTNIYFPEGEGPFPGTEVVSSRTFNGNALWGYINGGADLYLEYGFDILLAQKVKQEGKQYIVDIYKMKDSEAAFGIFSVSVYKCNETLARTSFSCITPYQVQFVKGPYYVSIVNEDGSTSEQNICKEFATKLEEKINDDTFIIPELFNKDEFLPFRDKIKLIKGRLGMENGFPQWASYFEKIGNFKLIVMPVESGGNTIYIAEIEFANDNSIATFLGNLEVDTEAIQNSLVMIKEKKMYLKSVGHKKIILLESPDDFYLLEKYMNLVSEPSDN